MQSSAESITLAAIMEHWKVYKQADTQFRKGNCAQPWRRQSWRHILCILAIYSLFCIDSCLASVAEIQQQKSTAILEKIDGLDQESVEDILNRFEDISYKNKRIFLAFCNLPDVGKNNIEEIFILVDTITLPFTFIPLLEHFTSTPDSSIESTLKFLARVTNTSFVSEKAVAALSSFQADTIEHFFLMMNRIEELDEAGQWAVQSLMKHIQPGPDIAFETTDQLAGMTVQQCRASEQLFQTNRFKKERTSDYLHRLSKFSDRDAEILRALFMEDKFSADALDFWLNGYFTLPPAKRDVYFTTLAAGDKTLLLAAYYKGASTFIWRINNLHDVTDSFGREIGSGRLAGYSPEELSHLFRLLHPLSRQKFNSAFFNGLQSGDRGTAVTNLRQATAHSRRQTAADMSSAQIYALLANGSELYDSSFRDILVPILKSRIASHHQDRLLDFLVVTDSSNLYISDFITNLAQKGKLTTFFPKESDQQKKILDLVAASALTDQESLILFSATFSRLLQSLQPTARSYLLDRLLVVISQKTAYSDQVHVILQYYLEEYPQLLSDNDKLKIEMLIHQRGKIDLTPYVTAPFDQWRQDGRLASLSVFQDDDDGRSSYHSYCRTLIETGYTPSVSKTYYPVSSIPARNELQQIISRRKNSFLSEISTFFQLSRRSPLAIDWIKQVNNIEIIHTVYVYTGETNQKKLLMIFLRSGHEMFAQRGHSYWRYEQLFQPLETLVKEKVATSDIFEAKQRFISLGSCGGIRAYSQLNTLFRNNVDILATVGTGKAAINNPYNQRFLEFVAKSKDIRTWQEVENKFARIFSENLGGDYIQPGSLPAILHKMRDTETGNNGTD